MNDSREARNATKASGFSTIRRRRGWADPSSSSRSRSSRFWPLWSTSARRLFFDHLVWSTHLYAFVLLPNTVLTLAVFAYFKLGGNRFDLGLPLVAAVVVYMFLALRGAFHERSWVAGIRALLLAVGFAIVIESYRLILFVVTYNLV